MKTNRLYQDLAWLWPLWGDPDGEYASFCRNLTNLFRKFACREVKTVLNLCCGGGKNVFNLKKEFTVTGLDISPAMLENARVLNPECSFIQADMRDFSLPEKYDAILVDDGIAYMTTEADLLAVFKGAYAHLQPGGVMFVGPDDTTETFSQNDSAVTLANPATKPANIDVVFVENNYDPDPNDTTFDALMIYIIRENGQLRIEQDMHTMGLFPLATWKRLVKEAGFEIHETSYTDKDREYIEFVGVKPLT
jgi:SAM-dependent methyltransferase